MLLVAIVILLIVALTAAAGSLLAGLSLVLAGSIAAGVSAAVVIPATVLFERLFPGDHASLGDPSRALKVPFRKLSGREAREAPNRLLWAEYRSARFRGRDAEFDSLLEWCSSDSQSGLAVITGPAGMGKTRLAAELCQSRIEAGRLAGFLKIEPSARDLAALTLVQRPTLIVVDDAESRVDQTLTLLAALAENQSAKRWRVVLLARFTGDWWASLGTRAEESPGNSIIASSRRFDLGEFEPSPRGRRDAFLEAADSFARVLRISAGHIPVPHLGSQWAERPLFLQMAALSALVQAAIPGQPSRPRVAITQHSLLKDALAREREYWHATASLAHLTLDDVVAGRAVAVATLVDASSEDGAQEALRAVPDLAGQPEGSRRMIARWLHGLYPGDAADWFKPLKPDSLGEALIASVLEESPVFAGRLLAEEDPLRAKGALRVFANVAKEYPGTSTAIEMAIATDLDRFCVPAMDVALEIGDPIGQIVAALVEKDQRPSIVMAVLNHLPEATVALLELAVIAMRAALVASRDGNNLTTAMLLGRLARYQADLGLPEEAVASAAESVEMYKSLASITAQDLRLDLARSLNNLSTFQSRLGRDEEALASVTQAVEFARTLVAGSPNEYGSGLALALSNQAETYRLLGRREDALASATEALTILRALVGRLEMADTEVMATALNNLSNRQAEVGLLDEALASAAEAVEIHRSNATRRPDAIRPDLARALATLANHQADVGKLEEALASASESVEIYRSLAVFRPDAFWPDLALALGTLANRRANLGLRGPEKAKIQGINRGIEADLGFPRIPSGSVPANGPGYKERWLRLALVSENESLRIYRSLAARWPDRFRREVAASLANLSAILISLDVREEAMHAIDEAVGIYRSLAAIHPNAFRPELAASLFNLSSIRLRMHRGIDGINSLQEVVGIYRALGGDGMTTFRPMLAKALTVLAERQAELQGLDQARVSINEAVSIYRALAADRPALYTSDLASSIRVLDVLTQATSLQ
jgi:tetratricopeptide (TPR) repeat protein